MCDNTNRRNNSEGWQCPCPYRDRCERNARSRENEEGDRGSRNNGCGESIGERNRTNGCSICNLFRRCCNR